jgi:hypothetical protein
VDESSGISLDPWRYGMHPHAAGLQVRSLGRIDLPLGEALRLEMASADPGDQGVAHVQYFIETEAGAWAIWISCPLDELPRHEARLHEIAPSDDGSGRSASRRT